MAMAMLNRRTLLGCVGAVGLAAGLRWLTESDDAGGRARFEIEKTDSEWRRILTKAQYDVLRLHRTEIPGSSPLNHEKRKGVFACAGCDLPLFSSDTKYDSGTGWPSFWQPLDKAVGTSTDYVLLLPRTEVHCRPLRRPSGPSLRGWSAADGAALLHERRRARFQAGRAEGGLTFSAHPC